MAKQIIRPRPHASKNQRRGRIAGSAGNGRMYPHRPALRIFAGTRPQALNDPILKTRRRALAGEQALKPRIALPRFRQSGSAGRTSRTMRFKTRQFIPRQAAGQITRDLFIKPHVFVLFVDHVHSPSQEATAAHGIKTICATPCASAAAPARGGAVLGASRWSGQAPGRWIRSRRR